MYEVIGNANLVSEGQRALEALGEFLDKEQNEELSISEIFIFENTPIRATLSDDAGHHSYVWAPAGWVKE